MTVTHDHLRRIAQILHAKDVGFVELTGLAGLDSAEAFRGAVMRALDHGYTCIGFLEGWKGFIDGKHRPLTLTDVEDIAKWGGTMLKTSRTNPFKRDGAVPKCLENFKKLDLHALIAMGENL